jgi:hypothetical protein
MPVQVESAVDGIQVQIITDVVLCLQWQSGKKREQPRTEQRIVLAKEVSQRRLQECFGWKWCHIHAGLSRRVYRGR